MITAYIRFCQQYLDPVWGVEFSGWIYTPVVRVTRNRLRKATFEWVGNARRRFDLAEVRKCYPIAVQVDGPLSPPPLRCNK